MSFNLIGQLVVPQSTELTHVYSGTKIKTTPPLDNGGDGSAFSPTDLFAISLGACATTIMSMFAQKNKIPLEHIRFEVDKIMSASPRKIAKIMVKFYIKSSASDDDFKRIMGAGKACPVRVTIQNSVEIEEEYLRV
ncbi:OsmC family protein [Silvanigrella aquatica]|uniref:Osmotically inducible protein OsmC n=1 Tax=Silvanigrella aquatica TaxID=1915309 RepID=A0A1L4CZ90_9BACT|nr:OsmC family protein [Silvanigrella aquatica]APJ03269.1 hypothetical protein AXG55_04875 [Silvanigrella aquatica]